MPKDAKKIYISKNDDIALAVQKIIDANEDTLTLHIPRFSTLAQSEENFYILKRESDDAKKIITIESVDDRVVELASAADIAAENPFFQGVGRSVADIVTLTPSRLSKPRATLASANVRGAQKPRGTNERCCTEAARANACADNEREDVQAALVEKERGVAQELDERFGPLGDERPKRRGRIWMAALVCISLSSVAAFLGLRVLPRAEIRVVAQKEQWVYRDAMVADKNIASPDAGAAKIPGQLFTEKRNVTLAFPASGKRDVAIKASGNIIISNAYSSEPQKLVATTRFVTSDGKILRLVKAVTVPGAKIVDGKIVPSSIEAGVIADKAGEEYNVAAGVALTIPGLKGTPKYDAFRGETKGAMSGGFMGTQAYPTDGDIAKAKTEIATTLSEGLTAAVTAKVPQEFKALEGSGQFKVARQTIDTAVNGAGAFRITAEADMSVMGIREVDMIQALHDRLIAEKGKAYEIRNETLSYGAARFDAVAGRMTFPVDFTSIIARKVDIDELRGKARAKPERDLKAMLLAVPGLESARVALWPFWVRSVPDDVAKVTISVE